MYFNEILVSYKKGLELPQSHQTPATPAFIKYINARALSRQFKLIEWQLNFCCQQTELQNIALGNCLFHTIQINPTT